MVEIKTLFAFALIPSMWLFWSEFQLDTKLLIVDQNQNISILYFLQKQFQTAVCISCQQFSLSMTYQTIG